MNDNDMWDEQPVKQLKTRRAYKVTISRLNAKDRGRFLNWLTFNFQYHVRITIGLVIVKSDLTYTVKEARQVANQAIKDYETDQEPAKIVEEYTV